MTTRRSEYKEYWQKKGNGRKERRKYGVNEG
jgi:hypothetical protein